MEKRKAFWLSFSLGLATECIQIWIPYRTFGVKDILMEWAGLILDLPTGGDYMSLTVDTDTYISLADAKTYVGGELSIDR